MAPDTQEKERVAAAALSVVVRIDWEAGARAG